MSFCGIDPVDPNLTRTLEPRLLSAARDRAAKPHPCMTSGAPPSSARASQCCRRHSPSAEIPRFQPWRGPGSLPVPLVAGFPPTAAHHPRPQLSLPAGTLPPE